jgi:hypothetical protein
LRREDGVWLENEEEKQAYIANYFSILFKSNSGHTSQQLLDVVETKVSPTMNESLVKEFTKEEIKDALLSIGDLKVLGLDGMSAIFYKNFWHIVGDHVVHEVLGILSGGPMLESWNNDTTTVLIPKVTNLVQVKDLWTISMCNVLYKLVAKVLANRLKQILPEVISPTQSAFVPGQLITDNILLAYEFTHYMRTRRKGNRCYAVIKLDMKAHDRVESHFLEDKMIKLGFCRRWT